MARRSQIPPVNQARLNTLICDDRADGRCECTQDCLTHKGRCGARHGHVLPNMAKWVHLEAVTRDGSKVDFSHENMVALCQNCLAAHRKSLVKVAEPEPESEGLFALPEQGTFKGTPTL